MKTIMFLAPATNYHTKKWCSYFVECGYDVHVVSLTEGIIPNVSVHSLLAANKSDKSEFNKLGYLFTLSKINKLYSKIVPDIVSVHYATSYGLLAAMSKINKYSLSVWGTDVYAFPKKSFVHKSLVKYSLKKATILLSTSRSMAKECKQYTDREFNITPFGVDTSKFHPNKENRKCERGFIISTMKSLSPEYGIDVLLKAIKILINKNPNMAIHAIIAGDGPSSNYLKKLSFDLGVGKNVEWLGLVSQEVVIKKIACSDIAVIPSYRESFGVAAVEAQACGLPVVISDVDGLKEATSPGETSLVFNTGDPNSLAEAILELYNNVEKRMEMGEKARRFVESHFEYRKCFQHIEKILTHF